MQRRGLTSHLKMKDREIACEYYLNEGNCAKGRAGTFRHQCQKCDLYKPKKHSRPARKNLRIEKNLKYKQNIKNFLD